MVHSQPQSSFDISGQQYWLRLQVALHVEPYQGRRAATLRRDLQYVAETYLDKQPALQRWQGSPVYYLYDQYRLPAAEWATLFDPSAPNTIRGTALDGVFLCLLVERSHLQVPACVWLSIAAIFISPFCTTAAVKNCLLEFNLLTPYSVPRRIFALSCASAALDECYWDTGLG